MILIDKPRAHGKAKYDKEHCRCSLCRKAKAEYSKELYYLNLDQSRKYAVLKYWKNPEKCRKLSKNFYYSNREFCIQKSRNEWKLNKDRIMRYRRANPQIHQKHQLDRRARVARAEGSFSLDNLSSRWSYYGGLCWMCHGVASVWDHVIALSKGGSNWPANLRPACRTCNARKCARSWKECV